MSMNMMVLAMMSHSVEHNSLPLDVQGGEFAIHGLREGMPEEAWSDFPYLKWDHANVRFSESKLHYINSPITILPTLSAQESVIILVTDACAELSTAYAGCDYPSQYFAVDSDFVLYKARNKEPAAATKDWLGHSTGDFVQGNHIDAKRTAVSQLGMAMYEQDYGDAVLHE